MSDKLVFEYFPISEIKGYVNNPRKNDGAVDIVKKSIEKFGWRVPIVLGKDNVIIAGHTRLKAAMKLGLQEVPVVWADDLSEEDQRAFRIMDNKSTEYAIWDDKLLKMELGELDKLDYDLSLTGFDKEELKILGLMIEIGDRAQVISLNPPEAPVLKERFDLHFDKKDEYDKVKKYLEVEGCQKILNLIS